MSDPFCGREADLKGVHTPNLIDLSDNLRFVLNKIAEQGAGVWIVGGAVRDALASVSIGDIDLAVDIPPREILSIFESAIPTGIDYGTVTIRAGDSFFECTTTRTEYDYSDGRRPKVVKWGRSLSEDLSRRDFTINAMAWDPFREILYDPYGGRKDLESGIIQTVGKAESRILEDSLRILRAYRLMSHHTKSVRTFSTKLTQAIKENKSALLRISSERIWQEFSQILRSEFVNASLNKMKNDHVLNTLIPEIAEIPPSLDSVQPVISVRLALLFRQNHINDLKKFLKEMKVSNTIKQNSMTLHNKAKQLPREMDLRLYAEIIGDLRENHLSLLEYEYGEDIVIDLRQKLKSIPPNTPPLASGDWIMQATGLQPGEKLGRLKNWLHRIQLERNITHLDGIESVLCTIPWTSSNFEDWPTLSWP